MSCHRLRRELIELFRFGGFDVRSAPHLDHLVECRACRDEVGLDRAIVEQLRVTLAERVAGLAPRAESWSVIRARAEAPERGLGAWLRGHALTLAGRLRTATTAAAMTLAVVIAAGTEVGIIAPEPAPASDPAADAFEARPAQAAPSPRAEETDIALALWRTAGSPSRRWTGPERTVTGEVRFDASERPAASGADGDGSDIDVRFHIGPRPAARAGSAEEVDPSDPQPAHVTTEQQAR